MERVPLSLEPDPVIEAYKKSLDRTLLRENLKLTPLERLRRGMDMARFAEDVRRAGREMREREAKSAAAK